MTLTQKFAELTPEHLEQFNTVKDAAGLEAFAAQHGIEFTEEEKAKLAQYLQDGLLPIDDDDLDAAAGGWHDIILCSHPYWVHAEGFSWVECEYCHRTQVKSLKPRLLPGNRLCGFEDCKCFACSSNWKTIVICERTGRVRRWDSRWVDCMCGIHVK